MMRVLVLQLLLVVASGIHAQHGFELPRGISPNAVSVLANRFTMWNSGILEQGWADACLLKYIRTQVMAEKPDPTMSCECPVEKRDPFFDQNMLTDPVNRKVLREVTTRTNTINSIVGKWAATQEDPQLVIVGAGFDTRAYGFSPLQNVTVFEMDTETMQRTKRTILHKCRIDPLSKNMRVNYFPLDLNSDEPFKALAEDEKRYDPTKPTMYIVESVLQYYEKEVNARTMEHLSKLALQNPQSRLVVTAWRAPNMMKGVMNQLLDVASGVGGERVKFWMPSLYTDWFTKHGWREDIGDHDMVMRKFRLSAPDDSFMSIFSAEKPHQYSAQEKTRTPFYEAGWPHRS